MDIREAYAIYERITCRYEDFDRIPEIFTENVVGGNASIGEIRGLEAQTIFLKTPVEMGSPPEEHLWCLIDGDHLAFRARNWEGERGASAYFDLIGHLAFDPEASKFCFYHGFYDPRIPRRMLTWNRIGSVWKALGKIRAMRSATRRFDASGAPPNVLADTFRVGTGKRG